MERQMHSYLKDPIILRALVYIQGTSHRLNKLASLNVATGIWGEKEKIQTNTIWYL